MGRGGFCALVLAFFAIAPATAQADSWYPHAADATWTYQWTDTDYNPVTTNEKVTVKEQKGRTFSLNWTTQDLGNPDDAVQSLGTMAFQETTAGLINTDWQSSPPPPAFPVLCAAIANCGNSVASVLYQLIWGSRAPVLIDPLLKGSSWSSTGGANGDVTSSSDYVGRESIKIPAFPMPVLAAKVRTDITQAGAIGDPYGSGVRIVWWVYNVGPVKIEFQHAGGTTRPLRRRCSRARTRCRARRPRMSTTSRSSRERRTAIADQPEAPENAVGPVDHGLADREQLRAGLREDVSGPIGRGELRVRAALGRAPEHLGGRQVRRRS